MSNLSKQKREIFIKFLEDIKTNASDEQRFVLTEIQKSINEKRYGLIWEEHSERVDEELQTHIPIFIEDKTKKISYDNNQPYNFLLEGDNLHSLYLLEKTHKSKIDFIYIDPPYNTGNKDFKYDDSYVSNEDCFIHSKWLSFMNVRLRVSKKLLTESGIICISIDENELCQLKELLDNIFGEQNFINIISVKTKIAGVSGSFLGNSLQGAQEFILIYAKDKTKFAIGEIPLKKIELNTYINEMRELGKSWKYTSVLKSVDEGEYVKSFYAGNGDEIKLYRHKNYVIKSINAIAKEEFNGDIAKAYYSYANKIFRTTNAQTSIRRRVINESKDLDFDLISIIYKPTKGKNANKETKFYYKDHVCNLVTWLKDVLYYDNTTQKYYKLDQIGTFWDDILYNNLTKEGQVVFSNGKKPLQLIKRLLKLHPNHNANVLDYFAGSGTTGHAVVELNREDGGNRKYILCTNNENNICEEVTYQRLKNIQTEDPHNLKYFKTDYVDKLKDDMYSVFLKNVQPLIELENTCDLSHSSIEVIFSENELNVLLSSDRINKIKQLFISSELLLDSQQQEQINKLNISVISIPEYYFKEELYTFEDF